MLIELHKNVKKHVNIRIFRGFSDVSGSSLPNITERYRLEVMDTRQVPVIVFTAKSPCGIDFGGAYVRIDTQASFALPYSKVNGELLFSVWPCGEYDETTIPVPALHAISFKDGRAESGSLSIIDWGDIIEAAVEPKLYRVPRREEPRLLDTMDFGFENGRARAELYTDSGLRLSVTPRTGERFSLALGSGTGGRLNDYDIGSKRLLTVSATEEEKERLILLNEKLEKVLDICGKRARIEEGAPVLYEDLCTVRGHERRTVYELIGGAFRQSKTETGFFGGEAHEPKGASEAALAFMEELRLGLEGWDELLHGGELEGASKEELIEFFGEYGAELAYPAEEPEGRATIGLINEKARCVYPRKFLFMFLHGRLMDINEL